MGVVEGEQKGGAITAPGRRDRPAPGVVRDSCYDSVRPWYFQLWHRDANPTLTSNFTDAVAVTFF